MGEKELKPVSLSGDTKSGDFYVATLTDRGFECVMNRGAEEPYLKANTPYLINMVSATGSRIEGTVTFIAGMDITGEKVLIAPTEPSYRLGQSQYNLIFWKGL